MNEIGTVQNAYRTNLGLSLAGARARADESVDPFVVTRRAMDAHAWVGGASDEFSNVCAGKGMDAGSAAGACVSALESRYAAEPPLVAPSDPRARFC